MKTRILTFVNVAISCIFISSCNKGTDVELLYGNLPVSEYYEGATCLSCNYESYTFFFDKTGWVIIDNAKGQRDKAQFVFNESKQQTLVKFYNSTKANLNGLYSVKIDTTLNGSQSIEVSIALESPNTFIKGNKGIRKKKP